MYALTIDERHDAQDSYRQCLWAYRIGRVRPTLREIVAEAARDAGLRVDDLTGESRTAPIVDARQQYMYRAAKLTTRSLPQIGAFINRHHSTVIHGIRAYAKRHNLPDARCGV